ncbi:phosphoenolpyruvate--protein phosphotransferase [bacterium]|nr:phosphoenolpyruvate--protein phosphotransferase [bacterium]
MKRIVGIKASPGIAIGRAFILDRRIPRVEKKSIPEKRVKREIKRFLSALKQSRKQVETIRESLDSDGVEELATILESHVMLLKDKALERDIITIIEEQQVDAQWAVSEQIGRFKKLLSSVGDEYLAGRTSDLDDLRNRILLNLRGGGSSTLADVSDGAIVIAHDLTPSEAAQMGKTGIAAFATELGSRTSHVAIMARATETPAVVGVASVLQHVKQGQRVIIDGLEGVVIISPTPKHIEKYESKRDVYEYYVTELLSAADLPAETRDGFRIAVEANIESPDDIASAVRHGASGIGLYRTEYIFMQKAHIPIEEEHFLIYKSVAEQIAPRSATIRTIDLGGEKLAEGIRLPPQLNPALGLRAIRLSFVKLDIFKQQIRGILRASVYGTLKIMFPMISGIEELRKAKSIVEECRRELTAEGKPISEEMEIGIMIEVPSATMTADILAAECDFFSIGTNDLIQYSVAIDRANEAVAYLYNPLHPGILRAISRIVDAAHSHRIGVGVCGEMAGEPVYALMLLGLGVDELSMNPLAIPAVKKIVRNSQLSEALEIARKALDFTTVQQIEAYIHRVMSKRYPQEIASLSL